jgi:hypothetical protein
MSPVSKISDCLFFTSPFAFWEAYCIFTR